MAEKLLEVQKRVNAMMVSNIQDVASNLQSIEEANKV
jgi:hypothetical protein